MQRRFEKQAGFLYMNLRHPSLNTKKVYHEKLKRWVWQARVNGGWRVYFDLENDTIYLLTLEPHAK